MALTIVTDSTCDLPKAELDALNVHRVPLYVHFEGQTRKDWLEIQPKEVMDRMAQGAEPATTSQPTPEDFASVYREAVAGGSSEILVVTISSDLSGTYQSATLAANEVDARVEVFDSQNASLGAAFMVRRAAAMRDAGKPLSEIVSALEDIRERSKLIFTVSTLEYLQKGGRIGRASALVGSLLNVKPILTLENGSVAAAGRARGAKKALKTLVDTVKSTAEAHPGGELVLAFLHIQDPEAADRVRAAIEEAGIKYRPAGVYEMGAVIGVHVGPGTYGAYGFVDPNPELGLAGLN